MKRTIFAGVCASVFLVMLLVVVAERLLVMRICGGEYIFPIDDTYIHLAMAKNLALHGVWGVEPGARAFCSSSPLWTLALSAHYAVFGIGELLPWLLAFGFNVMSAFAVIWLLSRMRANAWVCLTGALFVVVSAPFITTTALGMEHSMHGFCILATIVLAERIPALRWRDVLLASGLAAAATCTRYESLFLLLPLGVGVGILEMVELWRQGRHPIPLRSGVFVAASVMPVFAYGVWALCLGGRFLPNSLLLKGNFMTFGELVRMMIGLLGSVRPGCGFLYVLALSLGVVAVMPGTRTPCYWRVAAASGIIAIVGQMLFANVGQLCRYESYLTAAGAMVVVACAVSGGMGRIPAERCALLAVFAFSGWVFLARAVQSFGEAVQSSSDICNQQVLMTRIMSEIPEEDRGCVALNDLGYMAMYGGFPILDMWGLGSQDVAELLLKHRGIWLRDDYERLFPAHNVKYVVAFEQWYPIGLMPTGTIDVATLRLKDNFACGSDTVVFRATSPEAASRLERHLQKYVDRMPPRTRLWICR